jgi:transcriptional regulator with XRE-family HTH domain
MVINADDRFAELSKERQKAILARTEAITKEMTLAELRKACQQSQATMAKELGIKQAAVSRVERRADMRVSTLRDIVKALGGTLKIIAHFPGRHDVSLNLADVLSEKIKARNHGDSSALDLVGRGTAKTAGNRARKPSPKARRRSP